MGGLAGHKILETYIQAALLLWLLHTGMLCLSASKILHSRKVDRALPALGLGIIFVVIALMLAATDPNSAVIFRLIVFIFAATGITSALWLRKGPVVEVLKNQPENHTGESS